MSDNSAIEWTDATWNPVTGCTKVSPGCDHCYAETFAERWRGTPGHYFERGFDVQLRPDKLTLPLRWRKPRRVFVNSMSDLFHDSVPDEYIAQVFAVMGLAGRHTFQLLTKRHARMRSLLSQHDRWNIMLAEALASVLDKADAAIPAVDVDRVDMWLRAREYRTDPLPPLANVWLGVSVENQQWADIRIPALYATPAAVRFLSCEPLLGPVNLSRWLDTPLTCGCGAGPAGAPDAIGCCAGCMTPEPSGIDWVIAGGESGHGARPMHPDWARQLRDQCQTAGVPFLFKQWGEWGPAPWSVRVCDPAVGWQGTREELVQAKTRAEAEGATHLLQPWGHLYEPNHKTWSLERDPDGDYPGAVRRWGKKVAGRELDGRTWDEYPAVAS